MANDEMLNDKKYDLEKRTAKFGEGVVKFAKLIPKNIVTLPLISQFVRSGIVYFGIRH